jgi:subtilisin family serine protease
MTIAGYFIRASDTGDLIDLVTAAGAALTSMGGSPLRPLSSVTGAIDVAAYKEVSADQAFRALLRARATEIRPLEEQEWFERWKSREPEDLPRPQANRRTVVWRGQQLDWHLVETRTVDAWELFEDRYGGAAWQNLVAGHIDTGFTEHEALGFQEGQSSWIDTFHDYNFMAGKGAAYLESGSDFPLRSERAEVALDDLGGTNGGHGTKTLSVLCGYHGDIATGYRGAAPMLPTIPVRLSDIVWIDNLLEGDLPKAIVYLVEKGTRFISMSMGSPHFVMGRVVPIPSSLLRAIDYAYDNGVFLICAAGNNIPNPDVVYPARLNRTIAVAGTRPDQTPWCNSSRGPEVDISAPADPIYRAERHNDGSDAYDSGDGTSFATPQVCAAAALWMAWHAENINIAYDEPWQPIEAFRRIMTDTATPLAGNPARWRGRWGAGLLNVAGILNAPLPAKGSLRRSPVAAR